jgi:hypothetical protein
VPSDRAFILVVCAGIAFPNLFEGTNVQKSKNKIINKSSVSKFKEFSKLAHYLLRKLVTCLKFGNYIKVYVSTQ